MRYLLLSLSVIGTMGALATPAVAQDQALVERGAKVFAASKCSMCHSIAGKGNPKGMLDAVGTTLKADEIRQWIVDPATMREKTKSERKPNMKAYNTLPEEDVNGLVAYLQTLKGS